MSPLQQRAAAAREALAAAAAPSGDALQLRYRASRFRVANGVKPTRAAIDRMAEHRERTGYGKRKARDGKKAGWRKGQPQCPLCRRILAQRGGWCVSCQTFGGRHDHGR